MSGALPVIDWNRFPGQVPAGGGYLVYDEHAEWGPAYWDGKTWLKSAICMQPYPRRVIAFSRTPLPPSWCYAYEMAMSCAQEATFRIENGGLA